MDDRDLLQPLVLPVADGAIASDIDDVLARVEPERVRESTSFIFRVTAALIMEFLRARARPAREAVLRRAGGRPVCLLTTNASLRQEHALFALTIDGAQGVEHPLKSLRRICEEELRAVLRDAGDRCVFQAGHSFHFVTPAGLHVERFIRVADAIRSRDAVDSIAFWLQPKIAVTDAVLVDTWGIATPVLQAMHLAGRRVPFDCLPAYPHENVAATRAILERLIRAPGTKRILLVVSITGSGRLVGSITDILRSLREGEGTIDALSLYTFASSPRELTSLCQLPGVPESYSSQDTCKLCANHSTPLFLESDLYYVKARDETPVKLRSDIFAAGRSFVERYGHLRGVLRVHRQDRNDGRHHAFDVDVLTLLVDGDWADRFREKLEEVLAPPDVIVAPPHSAGEKLALLAKVAFPGAEVILHNDLRKARMSGEQQAAMNQCKNLLIVDDVLNSGSRLESFNRSLREDFAQPGFASITFLVGLARPRSERELKDVTNGLIQKHPWRAKLMFIESLYLPHWKQRQCPWCHETEFLMSVAGLMAEPPAWLDSRIARLNSTVGMIEDPLLLLPGAVCPQLGGGSPVAPAGWNAMQVLYTVALGLEAQRRIENDAERLGEQFPSAKVFSVENWRHRYTEGLLRAMFLRGVSRSEWGEAAQATLCEQLIEGAASPDQLFVRGEILSALGRNAVRAFSYQAFEKLFAEPLGSAFPFFARVLGLQQ